MIDWLLAAQPHVVRASRWIVLCCGMGLLGLASLPHNTVDRIIAIVGVVVIAAVFALWLGMALITILTPRLFHNLRRRSKVATSKMTSGKQS
jgi:hypothetical protein